jgi:hypothetical protein
LTSNLRVGHRRGLIVQRLFTFLLLAALISSIFALALRFKNYPLPGNQQGYEPEQPIAFSHKQHAGDLQVSCVYCHFGAETSPHAGIPSGDICFTCHRFVTASQKEMLPELLAARKEKRAPQRIVSPELQKLYEALGLDANLEPDPKKQPQPISWVKVHNLPAYACFDHRGHVKGGVACQTCHGPVETMERIRQVEDLSMGWCVNCHRESTKNGVNGKEVRPSIDCATCHH